MKVFRRMREKLFEEKKIRKYLAYAVGEILLVVIGILIALAINNSNQKRIVREKEQIYLRGLNEEFKTSQNKLKELIEVNHHNYDGARKILQYISGENEPPDEKTFSELLFTTFAFDIAFNPNNSLLNEMINSGSLKDIRNPELRIHLTNWLSTLDDIAKQENDLGLQREKVLDMFRSENNSLRTIFDLTEVSASEIGLKPASSHMSNLNLLQSTRFENNVLMFVFTCLATESSHYEPLMQDLMIILELIDQEIES
jgi:hypothetical protein